MKRLRQAPYVVAGFLAGIVLVLSCSDDSPRMADAAVCDCPVSEPPITGSRIVRIEEPFTVPPNDRGGQGARCPLDAIPLSGGCAAAEGQVPEVIIEQSIPGDTSWNCQWRNPTNAPIEVRAIVRCLKPAA